MKGFLCIIFTKGLSLLPAHIPPSVDALVKTRISQQFHSQYPDAKLAFDESPVESDKDGCPSQGSYTYTADSILLSSENKRAWEKSISLGLTGILDGIKIDFPVALEKTKTSDAFTTLGRETSRTWAYALGSGLALGLIGIVANIQSQSPKKGGSPSFQMNPIRVRSGALKTFQ